MRSGRLALCNDLYGSWATKGRTSERPQQETKPNLVLVLWKLLVVTHYQFSREHKNLMAEWEGRPFLGGSQGIKPIEAGSVPRDEWEWVCHMLSSGADWKLIWCWEAGAPPVPRNTGDACRC